MQKKITISHAFGPDNRGDHELLEKLIKILKEKYGHDSEIFIFTSFPEKSIELFKDKNLKFYKSIVSLAGVKKTFFSFFNIFLQVLSLLIYLTFKIDLFISKKDKLKLKIIKNSDHIFYCPGGYLYSNKQSYYANIFNGLLLRINPNPIYFSPMSIGPFYNSFDKFLFKNLVRNKDIIFSRESFTYNLCKEFNIKNNYLTTDIAWYNSKKEAFDYDLKWKNKFVVTVIDWDYNDLGNQSYYKNRYYQEIVNCCKILFDLSKEKVVLYNQVGSGKGVTNDEKLILKLLQNYPDIFSFDYEELSPEILKNRLHHCNGLVASRFHSALFSIQAECPFIALSYQPKAEYILKDLDLAHLSYKISDFNGDIVANNLDKISQDKSEYLKAINNAKEKCESLLKNNFIDKL